MAGAPPAGDFITLRVSHPWLLATREAGPGTGYARIRRSAGAWLIILVRRQNRGSRSRIIPRDYAQTADEQLMTWSGQGDPRAFDEIVRRHGPFALRIARRLVTDHAQAQDVVQEALVRAWTRAERFDVRRALLTTWLYRIVVNLCIDQRRRLRPEPMPPGFDPVDPGAGASEEMEIEQREHALALALSDLPPRQRAAMTLVYDEGLSGIEAARVLGLSAKAVERLLARARAFLRSRLLDQKESDDGSLES
jgi:RNA polymerase sigma-70 factor (ECF subfamily)